MISSEEAVFLEAEKGTIPAKDAAGKAMAARLELRRFLRLTQPIDGSIGFTRTDLGYDALLQFKKAEQEKDEKAKLSAVVARSPKHVWNFLNSNLITNVIVAVIAFTLGKIF